MRIAQIAPLVERVPPRGYGGTERVIHALTEELVRRGHEVTLFASGDSLTSAHLVSIYPKCLREGKIKNPYGANTWTLMHIGHAYELWEQFDIIHDHMYEISLPVAHNARAPTIMTVHNTFTIENRRLYQNLRNPYLVTISKSQAESATNMNHVSTVYNGINMEHYPFSSGHNDYLLSVGRICPEKATHIAIEAAKYLDMRLIIAAKLESENISYFKEYIEPHLSDKIQWIGEVGEEERNELMNHAFCFLHPLGQWKEPFGLSLIEAMACGCPVIGFNKGSIPEIIVDGKTGFIVNSLEEMIDAVSKIPFIDRKACREHALKNFNAKKMADGYEDIYRKVLEYEKIFRRENYIIRK